MLNAKEDAELTRVSRRANLMKATRAEQARYFELQRKARAAASLVYPAQARDV